MRCGVFVVGISVLCATAVQAQEADSSASTRRARLGLQTQATGPTFTSPLWLPPDRQQFGLLTLIPPDRAGEVARFSLPVGELAARGIRALSEAQRRRAERKSREHVRRVLQDFLAYKP